MDEMLYSKEEIYDYIFKRHLLVDADFVVSYWNKKKWLTKSGTPVKSLSAAVNVCNSIAATKIKREKGQEKYKEAIQVKWKEFELYKEQLRTKEWYAFRQFIFVVRGCECEMCGSKTNLQIHHIKYIKGRKAWEYLPDDVVVVCRDCHRSIHHL